MGAAASSRPYPNNPLCGNRPMAYPVTLSAAIAQFPWVYHWKYSVWLKPMVIGIFPVMYINYKIQSLTNSPANVEEWHERRWGKNGWYTRKYPPEYDCY